MRLFSLPLQMPTNSSGAVITGNGPAKPVRDMQDKYIQLSGPFAGTVNIEVSLNNGANFVPIASGLSGNQLVPVPQPASHIRVVVTAISSGTPKVVCNGFYDA